MTQQSARPPFSAAAMPVAIFCFVVAAIGWFTAGDDTRGILMGTLLVVGVVMLVIGRTGFWPPKRNSPMRRPQFTLRALLVATLVVAAFFGGLAVQRQLGVFPRPQFAALAWQMVTLVLFAYCGGLWVGWSDGESQERLRLAEERAAAAEAARAADTLPAS